MFDHIMTSESVHLLVLVHGMWGNPGHLSELERVIQENPPSLSSQSSASPADDSDERATPGHPELRVFLPQTNKENSTYDGIDWGGERVAEEILNEIRKIESDGGKKVTRFSITGYSLGGLISRYVIGILHQRQFFKNVTPVNFNTFATPHIGLPRFPTFFSSLSASLGPKLLSRTGEQFYCVDKWSARGRPLLEVMADPERVFYQALKLFPHIRIYANAVNDVTVPYLTSAIELTDPFADYEESGVDVHLTESYSPIVKSWSLPETRPIKPRALSTGWFKGLKPTRPILPPFLQFRFPLNVVLYVSLPVLIPMFMSMAIVRLYLASRTSQKRIKLLEKDAASGTTARKLVDIMAELEKDMEEAVVEMMDRSDPEPLSRTVVHDSKAAQQAALTPLQVQLVHNLNTLPQLEKELVFIPFVRNSHAIIVCRDAKRFPINYAGEGGLRHWADHFYL